MGEAPARAPWRADHARMPQNVSQQQNISDLCQEDRPLHSGAHPNFSRAVNDQLDSIRNAFNNGQYSQT